MNSLSFKTALGWITVTDFDKKIKSVVNNSAEVAKNRFEKEANLENIKIKEISKNKFKVYSGPYVSFVELKETYFSLNKLGFENMDIINTNK